MFENAFNNIDRVLRNDEGLASELDYAEQTSWVLFLKYLDDLEADREDNAALEGPDYTPILTAPYRRIGILLERKGMTMNHKKLYRLYRKEGLSVKRRRGRKRARGSRTPMPEAAHPNVRWSLDFLADSFDASRKFRILAVIYDCCRENLCLTADTSILGARVARELDALVRIYGKPACIVSDNVRCAE
jgi:transposase InsO family protein